MADDAFNAGAIEIPIKLVLDEATGQVDAFVAETKAKLAMVAESMQFPRVEQEKPKERKEPEEREDRQEKRRDLPVVIETADGQRRSSMPDDSASRDMQIQKIMDKFDDVIAAIETLAAAIENK